MPNHFLLLVLPTLEVQKSTVYRPISSKNPFESMNDETRDLFPNNHVNQISPQKYFMKNEIS